MSTASSRPLVLLDVDGVLNAVTAWGRSGAWSDWRSGVARAEGRDFAITWSPSVVAAVRSWQDLAEVQWLTTWGHDANTSLRHLLDLPELPVAATYADADVAPSGSADDDGPAHASVAPAAPDRLTGRWWKFDAVRRLVRTDPSRPIVWLDDDLAGQSDVRDWMHAHTTCLLVAPDPRSGLKPDELASVMDFLHRSASP